MKRFIPILFLTSIQALAFSPTNWADRLSGRGIVPFESLESFSSKAHISYLKGCNSGSVGLAHIADSTAWVYFDDQGSFQGFDSPNNAAPCQAKHVAYRLVTK